MRRSSLLLVFTLAFCHKSKHVLELRENELPIDECIPVCEQMKQHVNLDFPFHKLCDLTILEHFWDIDNSGFVCAGINSRAKKSGYNDTTIFIQEGDCSVVCMDSDRQHDIAVILIPQSLVFKPEDSSNLCSKLKFDEHFLDSYDLSRCLVLLEGDTAHKDLICAITIQLLKDDPNALDDCTTFQKDYHSSNVLERLTPMLEESILKTASLVALEESSTLQLCQTMADIRIHNPEFNAQGKWDSSSILHKLCMEACTVNSCNDDPEALCSIVMMLFSDTSHPNKELDNCLAYFQQDLGDTLFVAKALSRLNLTHLLVTDEFDVMELRSKLVTLTVPKQESMSCSICTYVVANKQAMQPYLCRGFELDPDAQVACVQVMESMMWWLPNEVYWNHFGCKRSDSAETRPGALDQPCPPSAICGWLKNTQNQEENFCTESDEYIKPDMI